MHLVLGLGSVPRQRLLWYANSSVPARSPHLCLPGIFDDKLKLKLSRCSMIPVLFLLEQRYRKDNKQKWCVSLPRGRRVSLQNGRPKSAHANLPSAKSAVDTTTLVIA